jgi:hypothetical protein
MTVRDQEQAVEEVMIDFKGASLLIMEVLPQLLSYSSQTIMIPTNSNSNDINVRLGFSRTNGWTNSRI